MRRPGRATGSNNSDFLGTYWPSSNLDRHAHYLAPEPLRIARLPLANEFLRVRDLVGCHLGRSTVAMRDPVVMYFWPPFWQPRQSEGEPLVRLGVVSRHSLPI